jgi:basic membrane lipoprotein Med (substrate-binding protein (PBP1-ABC) superfamily)
MKSRKFLQLIVSIALLAAMLSACAPSATPTPVTVVQVQTVQVEVTKIVAGTPEMQQVVVTATPPAATPVAKLKVFGAFATPIEEPWDGVIHQALLAAQAAGEIDYTFTENIGYSGDMERVLRETATTQKPDIIFGDAFGNEEAVRTVAAEFPQIAFVFGSGVGPSEPNLSVFDNWIHEPAYLCGMLAGGLTKTNVIGVVAAMPVPEVNRLVNAFIAGAKETNPKAKVLVSFINSFFDPAAAKEAALAQIDNGADVFYAERFGVIEAAQTKGLLVFGNMSDQNSLAPTLVVTGPVWNMQPTVEYVINQVKNHSYAAIDLKDFSMVAKGGASLAPFHGLDAKIPADLLKTVTDREAQIKSGLYRVDVDEKQPAPVN